MPSIKLYFESKDLNYSCHRAYLIVVVVVVVVVGPRPSPVMGCP